MGTRVMERGTGDTWAMWSVALLASAVESGYSLRCVVVGAHARAMHTRWAINSIAKAYG